MIGDVCQLVVVGGVQVGGWSGESSGRRNCRSVWPSHWAAPSGDLAAQV